MFCSKQAHTLIIDTHFRSLRAKHNNFKASYDELLKLSKCRSVHSQNLQLMVKEVYKSLNHIGPEIGWDAFEKIEIIKFIDPENPENKVTLDLKCGSRVKLPFPKNAVCLNSFDLRAGSA